MVIVNSENQDQFVCLFVCLKDKKYVYLSRYCSRRGIRDLLMIKASEATPSEQRERDDKWRSCHDAY
jgi:hypothetical protein